MDLYFLRHGIAVDHGEPGINSDADRALTSKGERKTRTIAKAIRALELSFDLILSSPYLRAKQTAEIVAAELKLQKKLSFSDELTPGGNPKALIQRLSQLEPETQSVVLVGHEPYLSKLIGLLSVGQTSAAIELKKGGLCKMEADALSYGRCATLCWLLTPKQMELMAD
jgi:phosphohistidine phosphatase